MLFIKKENVIKYYLGNKAEMKGWKSEHIMLLERLLIREIDVSDENFLVRGSIIFAAVSNAIKNNGDLLDVIRAIGETEIQEIKIQKKTNSGKPDDY